MSKTKTAQPVERMFANRMDKPSESASLFAQSSWWLADYAELWYDIGPHETQAEDMDCIARCQEMEELSRRLRELDEGLRMRQERGDTENAAEFILKILATGKVPAAVYWSPLASRWRVVGPDYRPQADDVLIGVYAPGADAALLIEDLATVESGYARKH
jgi:hypothetical protein